MKSMIWLILSLLTLDEEMRVDDVTFFFFGGLTEGIDKGKGEFFSLMSIPWDLPVPSAA